jgi:hypothetical protein
MQRTKAAVVHSSLQLSIVAQTMLTRTSSQADLGKIAIRAVL